MTAPRRNPPCEPWPWDQSVARGFEGGRTPRRWCAWGYITCAIGDLVSADGLLFTGDAYAVEGAKPRCLGRRNDFGPWHKPPKISPAEPPNPWVLWFRACPYCGWLVFANYNGVFLPIRLSIVKTTSVWNHRNLSTPDLCNNSAATRKLTSEHPSSVLTPLGSPPPLRDRPDHGGVFGNLPCSRARRHLVWGSAWWDVEAVVGWPPDMGPI